MASTFQNFVTLEKLGPNEFQSSHVTESNSFDPNDKVAYGGATLAFALSAAYATVKDGYFCYSCLGNFLGPAKAGQKLCASVTPIRDTRTFATRRLDIFQKIQDKTTPVMTLVTDFQVRDTAALLDYSAPPIAKYAAPEAALSEADVRLAAKNQGTPESLLKTLDGAMAFRKRFFETRVPPPSFAANTLHGMLPRLKSGQEQLAITDKFSGYYWRSLLPLQSPAENAAGMAFLLDAGTAVVPMAFAGLDARKITAVASLDFAIRFFSPEIALDTWHLREERTVAAGEGRTFSEARVWAPDGKMVASMSQQCILRGKQDKPKEAPKL